MLEDLNPEQREAVVFGRGPLLVIAGAGSGKTRVLTTRIAHLIREGGVRPWNILAFTFTNKAAREMRERVQRTTPEASDCWIGTFHATGVRILRREAERLGYPRDFTIYDADDSRTVIKNVLKARLADPKQFNPRDVSSAISRFKNSSRSPEDVKSESLSYYDERMGEFYGDYTRILRSNHAMDFDDLIARTVELFETHRDAQESYSERFQYVLVDEFQDTNPLQLILTKALSAVHGNLFAVGDDDQSIYSWRGATVENMLNFEDYFPGAKVLRLERNYRSTGNILRAANEVIAHNTQRRGKNLWTESGAGEPLELWWVEDEEDEASQLRGRIEELVAGGECARREIAILYRTNAQSRALEDALRRSAVPYQIVGGTRFYERREVRDLLAYLKLVVNPADRVSLARIANVPRRGIGKTSFERFMSASELRGIPPLELALDKATLQEVCGKAGGGRIHAFGRLIGDLRRLAETEDASRVLKHVLEATNYEDWLGQDDPTTAADRVDNVEELLNATHTFVSESDEGRLADFLESVALLADVDRLEEDGDMVTLMTMHNAKGLEFPYVFVAGCEEGLLPHANSREELDTLEEERRLFYVAITRAQRQVFMSAAAGRRRFGGYESADPSRFLNELPSDCLEERGERGGASRARGSAWGDDIFSIPGSRGSTGRRRRASVEEQEGTGAWSGAYGVDAFRQSQARKKAAAENGHGFSDDELTQEELRYAPGMRVRHESLGEGVVERVEGFGELTKLTIRFGDAGVKRILAKYARLEILNDDGEDLPF